MRISKRIKTSLVLNEILHFQRRNILILCLPAAQAIPIWGTIYIRILVCLWLFALRDESKCKPGHSAQHVESCLVSLIKFHRCCTCCWIHPLCVPLTDWHNNSTWIDEWADEQRLPLRLMNDDQQPGKRTRRLHHSPTTTMHIFIHMMMIIIIIDI